MSFTDLGYLYERHVAKGQRPFAIEYKESVGKLIWLLPCDRKSPPVIIGDGSPDQINAAVEHLQQHLTALGLAPLPVVRS